MDVSEALPVTREELLARYHQLTGQWTLLEMRLVALRHEMKAGRAECARLQREMRQILRQLSGDFRTRIHFKFHPDDQPAQANGRAIEAEVEQVV